MAGWDIGAGRPSGVRSIRPPPRCSGMKRDVAGIRLGRPGHCALLGPCRQAAYPVSGHPGRALARVDHSPNAKRDVTEGPLARGER